MSKGVGVQFEKASVLVLIVVSRNNDSCRVRVGVGGELVLVQKSK